MATATQLRLAELANEIARLVPVGSGLAAVACAYAAREGSRDEQHVMTAGAAYIAHAAAVSARYVGVTREELLATLGETYDIEARRYQ